MDFSSFNDQVNGVLDPLNDPTIKSILTLFLVMYGGLAAPSLPPSIRSMFSKIYFRIAVLFLILWIANKDAGLSIAVAIAFLASVNVANEKGAFEMFEGPSTAIYPGCMNFTVFDLLESFQNNKEALLNAMLISRVPGDITVNDYHSPLIATYLLSKGYNLKAPCVPPGENQRTGAWL